MLYPTEKVELIGLTGFTENLLGLVTELTGEDAVILCGSTL